MLHRLKGRWWIPLLFAVGGIMMISGVRRWLLERGPRTTIDAFVTALQSSDRAAADRLIVPEPGTETGLLQTTSDSTWRSAPDLKHRIHKLHVTGDFAIAEVWLAEYGYIVKPELTLERQPDATWRITRIDHVEIDPRWLADERRRRAESNEMLAKELDKALNGRPGVLVERDVPSDIRRR